MVALWAEVQRWPTRVAELEAKLREPVQDARNSRVPPSHPRQANIPPRPPKATRREASVGRAGGGRPLHPSPAQVILAKAKVGPQCGDAVADAGQSLQAVYDTMEVCRHVIRPSRGHGVIQEVLGAQRPTIWGAALSSAHQNHPAADWQVCWAHQWRAGPVAIDAGEAGFAPRMKAVLRRALARPKRRDTRAAATLYHYRCALQRRVARGLTSQPTHAHGRRLQTR